MFKIQTKTYSFGKRWQDLKFGRRFATEEEAWQQVAAYDQDGWIDRANYRVVLA